MNRRAIMFPAEAVALLGQVSDYEIARRFGLNAKTVFRRRRQLGIPACTAMGRAWSAKEIALVGREPDNVVAERAARTVRAAKAKRLRLGLPSALPIDRQRNRRRWSEMEIALLGVVSDLEVARRLQIARGTVIGMRIRLGIPAKRRGGDRLKSWARRPRGSRL